MSKHLIKILSICALIVLVPLIIVGSALCVTEAVPVTLTVFQGGEVYGSDASQYPTSVTVQVENETPVVVEFGKPITVKKNSLITLNYSNNIVYDFDGWFNGTDKQVDENDKAEELDSKYQFRIRSNTNITAIKNIKKFDVKYSGFYDDGETPIEYDSDLVNYGDALYIPTSMTGANFEGWYINSESTANTTTYTNATFNVANRDSNNEYITITLMPVWSNQMTITYYDSDATTVIEQVAIPESNFSTYALLTAEDVASYITPNYEFNAWLYNGSPITSISQIGFVDGAKIDLVLQESELANVVIHYFAGVDGKEIANVKLYEEDFADYALLTADDQVVKDAILAGNRFVGWTNSSGATITKADLTFASGTVYELYLSQESIPHTVIQYFTSVDNGVLIAQVDLYEDDYNAYQLLTGTDSAVTKFVKAGYEFVGWTNANGDSFAKENMAFGQNYDLYLDTNLVEYNVNVQYNAIDTDQIETLTYDVENDFTNYTITRDGYSFVGLVYAGNTYTANGNDYVYNGTSLGDAVVANNGLTVTALWQADAKYGSYVWTGVFDYQAQSGTEYVYTPNGDGTYSPILNAGGDTVIDFADVAEEGYAQLEDSIFNLFFAGLDTDNLYALVNGEYVKVNVTEISIDVDNFLTGVTYEFSKDVSFKEILDIMSDWVSDSTGEITIRFVCEVA